MVREKLSPEETLVILSFLVRDKMTVGQVDRIVGFKIRRFKTPAELQYKGILQSERIGQTNRRRYSLTARGIEILSLMSGKNLGTAGMAKEVEISPRSDGNINHSTSHARH